MIIRYICGVGIRFMGRGIRSGCVSLVGDLWWRCNILDMVDRCIIFEFELLMGVFCLCIYSFFVFVSLLDVLVAMALGACCG